MPESNLTLAKKAFYITSFLALTAFLYSFGTFMSEQEWVNWCNKFLTESYDPSLEPKLKKYEIMLTPDHFIRLRKTYQQGKQEYYSFNLRRFSSIVYLPGTGQTDTLQVHTQTDDIIIQTYDDPEGDVDSMATTLSIPVKKIAAGRIDSLKQALGFLKVKGL